MTSDRPYRAARSFDDAADELIRCAGAHFDPAIVEAFTRVPIDSWREMRELATQPGLAMKDYNSGREIRYSLLTMTGDRAAG